jgi:hypothetical protein
MELVIGDPWVDELITSDTIARAGTGNAFYRAARAGKFITLARGVHIPSQVWDGLDVDARFRGRIHAAALASGHGVLFSHLSAAAMWRLPMVGSWPLKPEILTEPSGGGKKRAALRVHTTGVPDATAVIDGLAVTRLARTVADVARTALLGTAVAMADAALSREAARLRQGSFTTRIELKSELVFGHSAAGRARLARVLDLADGQSGSPGESVSRVAMHLLGFPRPVLQQEFRDRYGFIGVVDFWWPEYSLIGEFDGNGKYMRDEMLNGRSPAEVVVAEKVREDRLRAQGPKVVRWDWHIANSPAKLASRLEGAGLSRASPTRSDRVLVK